MDAAELQAIIDRLNRELVELQQKNLTLQSRIDQLLAPAKSPDDLASALQRTVDRLQTELASLSNPVSNFAVKDFRLETAITVSMTELGTIEYRLLQPGTNVDPNAISKLTLSLVPIEKQRPDGTLSPLLFQPGRELSVVGMREDLLQTFERNHIYTIGEFRSAVMRAQVRSTLIASEKTTQQELSTLQARAELLLLAGMDRKTADRLMTAGIDGLPALARWTPEGLILILRDVEKAQLTQWISAAQAFTGITAPDPPQAVVVVDTDPTGLLVRVGTSGPYSTIPYQRQLPPSDQPLALGTLRYQLREDGVGYAFTGWSTGEVQTLATIRPTASVRATARFRVACYSLTASTVSPGGRLELAPAIGGVAGFPAHCYAPGTSVRVTAVPEDGFRLESLTIVKQGTPRVLAATETVVVMDAPVVARAVFVERERVVGTGLLPRSIGVSPAPVGVLPAPFGVSPESIGASPEPIGASPTPRGVSPAPFGDSPEPIRVWPAPIGD